MTKSTLSSSMVISCVQMTIPGLGTTKQYAGGLVPKLWPELTLIVCHYLLKPRDYITGNCADQSIYIIHETLGKTMLSRTLQFVSKIQMMHHALHL